MLLKDLKGCRIFLKLGFTDMRKSINGLSLIVQEEMGEDLFSESVFVFCNKRQRILKVLYWDANGFCLWQKRLEKHRFIWPRSQEEVRQVSGEQFSWLLKGLDFTKAHQRLHYWIAG